MFTSFGYKLSAERDMTSFCIFSIYFDACDITAVQSVFSKWENEGTKQSKTVRLSTSTEDSPWKYIVSGNYSHNLPVSDVTNQEHWSVYHPNMLRNAFTKIFLCFY